MKADFRTICKMLAARRCFSSGESIGDIARSANVSPATIKRWLAETGVEQFAYRRRMR